MADFPDSIYDPRTKSNKSGVVYDEDEETTCFAEDLNKLDDEVVAIETFLLPQYIFGHIDDIIPVAVGGTFVDIPFNDEVSTPKKGITHNHESDSEQFTITKAGVYEIKFTLMIEDTAVDPAAHVEARVVKNGTEIHGSLIEEDISGTPQSEKAQVLHNCCIVALAVDDVIKFQFTANDTTVRLNSHKTYGDHKDTAIIDIHQIG